MRTRKRGVASLAGIAALALAASACGGSSGGKNNSAPPTQGSAKGYIHYATNAGGTPVKGGILNVLGTGDVDYLDGNLAYYTVGDTMTRLFSRQLYSYSGQFGHTTEVVPDLATGDPQVSPDGLTQTVTMRNDVYWDTNPKRIVTAADVVRGVKVSCNPAAPFGGQADYNFMIVGYESFCNGFAKVAQNAAAFKNYINTHNISGVTANGQTVTFKLTQPVAFFKNILSLSAFAPRPVEALNYVPGSAASQQHVISDGPYKVKSYVPTKSLDFIRNPVWVASTDPVRKAWVNEIKVVETLTEQSIQQQLETNTPSADVSFAGYPPVADIPGLIARKDPNLNSEPSYSNDYLLYNCAAGPLKNVLVRRALNFAVNRTHLIQDAGGPQINPPLTHVLIDGMPGSKTFDLYPHNIAKAQALMKQANVGHIRLTFMYRQGSTSAPKELQSLQQDLKPIGVSVKALVVPDADLYVKYLYKPNVARKDTWDIAAAGWLPDWYGAGSALSFFRPLFDGRILPPASSDFGLYNSPAANALFDQAAKAKTEAAADVLWAQADRQVMSDAPLFPLYQQNQTTYHASQVHNAVYIPSTQDFDYANLWLDPSKNGD